MLPLQRLKRVTRAGATAILTLAASGALWAAWTEPSPRVAAPVAEPQRAVRREDFRPAPSTARAEGREFFFTRAIYSGGGGRRFGGSWATDYPKADQQFLTIIDRLVDLDAYERENAVQLDDPQLRRFPFLYALEVGYMYMTEPEVRGLRDYLLAGGFLMIDDFWGTQEWANFEAEIRRVLPEYQIVDVPLDHPVFNTVYNIDQIVQVPNISRAQGGPTWQRDGAVPHVRGIFDDHGRLMVAINWNTDIGDAWEWAESPYYPLKYSTYAIEITVNLIVYAMSH
ncbi:MAG: DUF4159 domain-containing protein [Acidobacteria bacterium]|nr:DUF4159 domain-containing protein [Acidobacteriota bacterium]